MRSRAYAAASLVALLSCVRTPPSTDVGDAKTSLSPSAQVAPRATSLPKPETSILRIDDDSGSLAIKALDGTGRREAMALRSSDGKYTLELDEAQYVIRGGSPRRLVSKGTGWYARWVSESEIAFLDNARRLAKRDAADLSAKTLYGSRVCGGAISCEPDGPPPMLEWVSRDLEWAVVRGSGSERFVIRRGEATPVAALFDGPDSRIMALGVGKVGSLCILTGRDERAAQSDANVETRIGSLRCAQPPWTTWRRVRDFSVEGPFEMVDEDAQLKFFSDRDLVVSLLPANPDSRRQKFVHCLVTIETAAARCTPNARPVWYPVGDGRWVLEHTVIDVALPRLIDVERGRSWAIGEDRQAVYGDPLPDARVPGSLVLRRADKADVRAGTVALPADR